MQSLLMAGAALVLAVAPPPEVPASAAATPATMTRIVVRLVGGAVKPGSHAALPKVIYVADPHYARIEDPPDARVGVQKLTIIAEPDAYSVNLLDHKGTHALDKGGEGDLHLPIVLPFDPKHRLGALDSLQFGDEFEGFQSAGAVHKAGPIINAKPTDSYFLSVAHGRATLIVRAGSHTPVMLKWADSDGSHTYEYIEYNDVPFDPSLFQKPEHIQYRELPPADGKGEEG